MLDDIGHEGRLPVDPRGLERTVEDAARRTHEWSTGAVLLVATVHQVRASMLHQALEWPHERWATRDPSQGPGCVQMILRLGYGPEGAPTPRRPLAEVVDAGPAPL